MSENTVTTDTSKRPVIAAVRGLTLTFAGAPRPVVENVSCELRAGEITALVGESGSGKSLTARALIGLLPPSSHTTYTELVVPWPTGTAAAPPPHSKDWQQLRGAQIAFVPQDALGGLDPLRKVEYEVSDTLRIHRRMSRQRSLPIVHAALEEAGIPDPIHRSRQYPHELSGGLRQRVLIAAAIVDKPSLIIADEPTTALDAAHRDRILSNLRKRASAGAAVLLITHDLVSARHVADQVLVMREGRIIEHGTTSEIFEAPKHPFTRELLDASLVGRTPFTRSQTHNAPARTTQPVTTAAPSATATAAPTAIATAVDRATRAPAAALELRNVSVAYGPNTVIHDASFTLLPGRTLGLIGASGSGKTTLLRTALGLHRPQQGTVLLNNELFSPQHGFAGARAQRLLRQRISYVPQDPLSTFPRGHTGKQILSDAARAARIPRAQRDDAVRTLATDVGLQVAVLERPAVLLSGGERQRLAIARSLAGNPAVLLLDEPVSALDLTVQARILDLLLRLQRERNTAYLLVSHDPDVITYLSHHTVHLRNGTVLASAPGVAPH